ncbi:MAG: MBOAT family protein, partial [Planctomycetes bacterium]|nr:MBOAT family protein [Planctomycetota bacterium]
IILPVGISFYTFQTLSYTIDIYRKKLLPAESFREFALFVVYFPQLVAGPIVRAADLLPQLRKRLVIHAENLQYGLTLLAWGMVKKVVVADNLAPGVNRIFHLGEGFGGAPVDASPFEIVVGAFLYGVQIYCDFSGYSDMALGSAALLGVRLPMNFNAPYAARSVQDFWRRWHISLSTWLRDYLYIPLGGNRGGPLRTTANLMITMLLGGLWHGASWNFVLWGALHGGYLGVGRLWQRFAPDPARWPRPARALHAALSWALTQYCVFLAWLVFLLRDTRDLHFCLHRFLAAPWLIWGDSFRLPDEARRALAFAGFFVLLHLVSTIRGQLPARVAAWPLRAWTLFLAAVGFLLFLFTPSDAPEFIYYQF